MSGKKHHHGKAAKAQPGKKGGASKPTSAKPSKPAADGAVQPPAGVAPAYEDAVPQGPPPAPRQLPSKEASAFKNILKLYEFKQYKKGLKAAEAILKKVPNHGETTAMKALFMSHLDAKKDDAYDTVREAVRLDPASHIVHHVHGLMHRADKNYAEASKCYIQALTIEKDNVAILRDLAVMQLQLRDYKGYMTTKQHLIKILQSHVMHVRPHWLSLAVANHLQGNLTEALDLVQKWLDSFPTRPAEPDKALDYSEILFYKASLLEQAGDHSTVLTHLDDMETFVLDKWGVKEIRARIFSKIGRNTDAMELLAQLVERNPDNAAYIEALIEASGERSTTVLEGLIEQYPKADLAKLMLLRQSSGDSDAFLTFSRDYVVAQLNRRIPSLFTNLKSLIQDPEKRSVLCGHVHAFLASPPENQPESIMWAHYYLAQHHDYLGELPEALACLEHAFADSPTEDIPLELYMLQARIYKHSGDLQRARELMNAARERDLKDRSINTKAVKYMLRAGDLATAEESVVLFTRPDIPDKLRDLVEMQCMWWACECAELHTRQSEFGLALKRFHQVLSHFDEIEDDQYDFHTYCMRKATLTAYADMMRFEDRLRDHPYFIRAARGAVDVYLQLHDDHGSIINGAEATSAAAALSKRKLAPSKDGKKPEKDPDPLGKTYLNADPLEAAHRIVGQLEHVAQSRRETHLLGFEVYLRQHKWMLALRSLKRLHTLEPAASPDLHSATMRFAHAVRQAEIPDALRQPITRDLADHFGVSEDADLFDVNRTFLSGTDSLVHVWAFARTALALGDRDGAVKAIRDWIASDATEHKFAGLKWAEGDRVCRAVARALGAEGIEAELRECLRAHYALS